MIISLQAAADLLLQSKTLAVTGHIHPDGDCLGSMLALAEYLEAAGKKVLLLLDDEIHGYDFLPGSANIRRPGKNPVNVDLLVVVDASDIERISSVRDVVDAKILNIDHHISNTGFADYLYMNTQASATGEIILELLRLFDTNISINQAINLYTAIATDCGFFRYANTTATTLRYAAELIEAGAQPHTISEYLETRPLKSILILKRILDTLEIHHDGFIASITLTPDIIGENGSESTEGLINYPRNIEGVEIAIMFKIVDENTTRVSFRSRNADVSKLAMSFGGGGHARAAGCTINGKFSSVKRKVLSAAEKVLKEAGQ